MKIFILTMRIEAEDGEEITPQRIRDELYDACPDVPFGFDITSVEEEN